MGTHHGETEATPPGKSADLDDLSKGASRLQLLEAGEQNLRVAGRDAPRRTAAWLLAEILDCDPAHLYAQPEQTVVSEDARQFTKWIRRRLEGEPLQHILGYASFRDLRVEVTPEVMVPRPETEQLVEVALRSLSGSEAPRVLDVGTGSGCIALALKHECPDAEVYACDISTEALAVARRNAKRLGLDIHFAEANLESPTFLERMPRQLDLLVANPPYVPDIEADTLPPVVRDYDPPEALFAGTDPLRFYRPLTSAARALCALGASTVLEAHADHASGVATLLREQGFASIQVHEDQSGRPRIVRGERPSM